MKSWKKVRKDLKKTKTWKLYKEVFHHHQLRLAFSKIALIFDKNIDIEFMINAENSLLKDHSKKGFEKVFITLKTIDSSIQWKDLGSFAWYAFQTSTYFKDIKINNKNIFTDDYVKQNNIKRKYYSNWLHSLNPKDKDVNIKIIGVLKQLY